MDRVALLSSSIKSFSINFSVSLLQLFLLVLIKFSRTVMKVHFSLDAAMLTARMVHPIDSW